MSKKLLQILKMLTKDVKDVEFYSEEMLNTFSYDEQELLDLGEELAEIEAGKGVDEDELDILKSLLVYILLKKSSFEKEDIYSLVFGGGRRIIWN
ncbi:MAG: hypothetical protein P8013_01765 [Candidatus Sulfobium sp.]